MANNKVDKMISMLSMFTQVRVSETFNWFNPLQEVFEVPSSITFKHAFFEILTGTKYMPKL